MARKQNKVKIPGRAGAKWRMAILLFFVILGVLISTLTLPEYTAKLGAERAIPEAYAGCAALFLIGAIFWGLLKWFSTVGVKTFQSVRWVWNNWETFFIIGYFIKFLLWLFCHIVPTFAIGFLFAPAYWLLWKMAEQGVTMASGVALFGASCVLVIWMLIWDIRKLSSRK